MTADEPFVDQDKGDPQSWNLYTYAANNPLRYNDPTEQSHTDSKGYIVGDKDGECNSNGDCWSEKNQQWEKRQPPKVAPDLNPLAAQLDGLFLHPKFRPIPIVHQVGRTLDALGAFLNPGFKNCPPGAHCMVGMMPLPPSGAFSEYVDITRPGSIRNKQTNVTPSEFGATLEQNGFYKVDDKERSGHIHQGNDRIHRVPSFDVYRLPHSPG